MLSCWAGELKTQPTGNTGKQNPCNCCGKHDHGNGWNSYHWPSSSPRWSPPYHLYHPMGEVLIQNGTPGLHSIRQQLLMMVFDEIISHIPNKKKCIKHTLGRQPNRELGSWLAWPLWTPWHCHWRQVSLESMPLNLQDSKSPLRMQGHARNILTPSTTFQSLPT